MKLKKLLPTFSLPARFKRIALTTAFAGLVASTASAQLVISFEESEGFTAGSAPVGGSTGWQGSGAGGAAFLYVTDSKAYEGSQSVVVRNGANNSYFARTADGNFLYDYGITSIDFYFSHEPAADPVPNTTIARWDLYYSNSADQLGFRMSMELRYPQEGNSDFSIYFSSDNNAFFNGANPGSRSLPGSAGMDLTQWNKVSVWLDHDQSQLYVSVNGITIGGAAVRLHQTNFTADSRINGIRLQTPTISSNATGTTYFDYFVAIPEPSTSLMTLAVLGGGWLLRRKGRNAAIRF